MFKNESEWLITAEVCGRQCYIDRNLDIVDTLPEAARWSCAAALTLADALNVRHKAGNLTFDTTTVKAERTRLSYA